jgi:hypothetical protein
MASPSYPTALSTAGPSTAVCSGDSATSAREAGRLGRVTTLRWAHEACLAKSVFETGACRTCRKSVSLINAELVLARAATDGDTDKV